MIGSLRARLAEWRHAHPEDQAGASPDPSSANALITIVACAATVVLVLTVPHSWQVVQDMLGVFLLYVIVTFGLQIASVPVYDRGAFTFAGAGMLAIGFMFGAGAAMVVAAAMGIV